jgi:hypothetical protein
MNLRKGRREALMDIHGSINVTLALTTQSATDIVHASSRGHAWHF